MYVPTEITTRVEELSARLGCSLMVARCWKSDDGRRALYCNFRGVLNESPELKIEVAGTLCAELTPGIEDETDLFIFINGQRVGLYKEPFKYLIAHGKTPFHWEYNDEGFDQFDVLDSTTFSAPIDESLAIDQSHDS